MMQQYLEVKAQNPDCILFFRLGDFYEMFFEDAIVASKAMEVTLTARNCGLEEKAPMCGVPYHAVDTYLARLLDKGFKVAICEQVEDPALAKGLVKREIIRIVTPGTALSQTILGKGRTTTWPRYGLMKKVPAFPGVTFPLVKLQLRSSAEKEVLSS